MSNRAKSLWHVPTMHHHCAVQVSAAAFTKGLLALEGSSLTPILVSLVTKDASMLDAFGKVRHPC